MKREEMLPRLKEWAQRHAALHAQYEALRALTGADCECPLMRAVFDVWDAYTEAVAEMVGDKEGWLKWYEQECDMGRSPKEIISIGGRKVTVRTLKHLATVIASNA